MMRIMFSLLFLGLSYIFIRNGIDVHDIFVSVPGYAHPQTPGGSKISPQVEEKYEQGEFPPTF